jgi:phage baseplate assembly protein W
MPKTLRLNESGGFTFRNGEFESIGTPNVTDKEEIAQAVGILLRTQTGTDLWNPDYGLNYDQMTGAQFGEVRMSVEDIVYAYIRQALTQEPRVDVNSMELSFEPVENNNLNMDLKLRAVTGEDVRLNETIGEDTYVK